MASPLPSFERLPCPTVQLLHELPGGESHIDWMIARDPDGSEPLATFRIAVPLDEVQQGERIAAQRIGDHRPAYLDYEGRVSNNRGIVTRLARGEILSTEWLPQDDALIMQVHWSTRGGREIDQSVQLAPETLDQWSITCVSHHESPAAAAVGIAKEKP